MKKYLLIAFFGLATLLGGCNKGKTPSVETAAVTHITDKSAECGGVVSDNGASVVVRGVCWNVSPNPTIDNFHSTDGGGTGSFSSFLENLSPNTTYYVRAYAMNDYGVGYGEENTFTTLEAVEEPDTLLYTRMLCKPKGWRMITATSFPAYELPNGTNITDLMQGWFYDFELDDILVFRMDGTHWIYDNSNAVTSGSGHAMGQWYFDNPITPQTIHMRFINADLVYYNCQILALTENEFKIKFYYNVDSPAKNTYTFTISYVPTE